MKPQPSLTLFSHLWLISREAEEVFCLSGWLSPMCLLRGEGPHREVRVCPRSRTHVASAPHPVRLPWAVTWTQGLASKVHGAKGIPLTFPSPGLWHSNCLRAWLLTRGGMVSSTASAHFGPNWPELESLLSTHQLCPLGHVASPLSTTTFSSLPQD